jgi:four helix bundle protein
MGVTNYRELVVWQKAMDLACVAYELTRRFPSEERYGLSQQLRRAAVSIASNIAEGQGRQTTRDFLHFLYIANGSLRETETQTLLSERLQYITADERTRFFSHAGEVGRLLMALINSLKRKLQDTDK